MASSSGTSSGSMTSSAVRSSGSEEDLRAASVDDRKRKRMISNRESARRSRMRKQKHLDELTSQIGELHRENQRIAADLNAIAQDFMAAAAENSILRAQADELTSRLQSLNEIIAFLNANAAAAAAVTCPVEPVIDGFLMDPVSLGFMNQPILASAEMFNY